VQLQVARRCRAGCAARRSCVRRGRGALASAEARVAATSSRVGADGRRGGQRRRRRPAAASTPPPPPSLSTSFDGMRRLAGRVQSSSGGAAAAGADGAVAAPLIGEPALPRGAPAAGGVFRRCGGRCRREGRAHGGGGAALTAADGGGEGPSAGRRSVAAIAVACRLAGPASGPRRSGLPALHDWRGDKAIEAEHMRWRRRPRLARDRRLAPLGSATIRGAPASARSRPLHGARQRRRDASALAPPPPHHR